MTTTLQPNPSAVTVTETEYLLARTEDKIIAKLAVESGALRANEAKAIVARQKAVYQSRGRLIRVAAILRKNGRLDDAACIRLREEAERRVAVEPAAPAAPAAPKLDLAPIEDEIEQEIHFRPEARVAPRRGRTAGRGSSVSSGVSSSVSTSRTATPASGVPRSRRSRDRRSSGGQRARKNAWGRVATGLLMEIWMIATAIAGTLLIIGLMVAMGVGGSVTGLQMTFVLMGLLGLTVFGLHSVAMCMCAAAPVSGGYKALACLPGIAWSATVLCVLATILAPLTVGMEIAAIFNLLGSLAYLVAWVTFLLFLGRTAKHFGTPGGLLAVRVTWGATAANFLFAVAAPLTGSKALLGLAGLSSLVSFGCYVAALVVVRKAIVAGTPRVDGREVARVFA